MPYIDFYDASTALERAVFIVPVLLFVMIPTIVASIRNHCSFWGILVANIFFGWVPIFWPLVLIWSLSGKHDPEKPRSAKS